MRDRLQAWCREVVRRSAFDASVFALILVSVTLVGVELSLPQEAPTARWASLAQEVITGIFVVELSLRYLAVMRFRRFLREYWLDILAVLPVLRVFRLVRAFLLLRLLRLLSLPQLMSRHMALLGHLFRRRYAEYLLYTVLLAFVVLFGTVGLAVFEGPREDLARHFWAALFSLFAGEYITDFPRTLEGKLVALFVLFSGLGFFAVVIGTVSAVMIEKLKEGAVARHMSLEDLEDHIVVCGWNSGVETMLREIQSHKEFADTEVVVIAEREEIPQLEQLPRPGRVRLIQQDFTRAEVLERANVRKAAAAIIVSDVSHGRTRQDADARTVLAALTIEKLNPRVHTCAELSNAANEHHLRMGHVNEIIITREIAGNLLAQAAMSSAAVAVLKDLITPTRGGYLLSVEVDRALAGMPFEEALTPFRKRYGHIPVAVQTSHGEIRVNPDGHRLMEGEHLICVGRR